MKFVNWEGSTVPNARPNRPRSVDSGSSLARSYNPIVRQVATSKDMDIVDCARLFALTSMVGADAIIAVLDAKYTYNLWRPVTAIRNADQTNNSATPRDAS